MKSKKNIIISIGAINLLVTGIIGFCSFFVPTSEEDIDNNEVNNFEYNYSYGITNTTLNNDISIKGNATISFNNEASSIGGVGGGISFNWNNLVPSYKNENDKDLTGTYSIQIPEKANDVISFKDGTNSFSGTWDNLQTPDEIPEVIYKDNVNTLTEDELKDLLNSNDSSSTLNINFNANAATDLVLAYSYNDTTSSYSVSGYTAGTKTVVNIPSTYDDGTNGSHYVTSIDDNVFEYNSYITTITLSNVTTIGNKAFIGCKNLTETGLSSSTVSSIKNSAFEGCSSLTTLSLPNSINNIGKEAFAYCTSLNSVTLPTNNSNFANINPGTFRNCTSLTALTLPASINNVYDYAFTECTSLVTLTLGVNISIFDTNSFLSYNGNLKIHCPTSIYDTYYNGILKNYKWLMVEDS